MLSDKYSERNSLSSNTRLPSLLALRCFETAARLENFSRAADELHLTHGAVSRAVRLLEDELGLALFERRSRRVFLTDAGRRLAMAVSDGFDLIRHSVSDLRADSLKDRRWVLSCEPTLLMRWLIPRWPDFLTQHPEVDVLLVAGGGPLSFGSGIDLAIRRDDFPWPDSYHVETIFAERIGPVCRPDKAAAWLRSKKDTPALLEGAPRLRSRTRPRAWHEWAEASGQPITSSQEQTFEHFYFSLQAAVAGLGVAIGPWNLVRDDLDSGVLVAPLGFIEDGSRYCLLSPKPLPSNEAQADLLTWLRAMA